jgi:subtilisin family serine protease
MPSCFRNILAVTATAFMLLSAPAAVAQSTVADVAPRALALQGWMSGDVGTAWSQGYKGQGVTITVVDDFKSQSGYYGDLGTGTKLLRHGEWTRLQASMIAPKATMRAKDFTSTSAVSLARGLNVLNLSYGMFANAGLTNSQIGWSSRESSIISYATKGSALVSKAAGNDGIAVGGVTAGGKQDYLASALVGTKSAIFVGALTTNGSTTKPASMASYSNFAGADPTVQSQYLVVGVEGHKTGLYGTSFAAPVVAGYGAILGSKFTKATPTQITNQLLTTARKDTVRNYDAFTYGQGEASLARALAPKSIR